MNEIMQEHQMGECRQQLYAQFLYRILLIKKIYNISECYIGTFSLTILLTGSSFKKFRKEFLKQFAFQKGILFFASHFSDVKNRWGIAFTIWKSGSTDDKNDTDVYLLSSASSTANGISIFPENFKKIVSNFAARKLITGKYVTWLNDKDEYCVPNIENPSYQVSHHLAIFVVFVIL